MILFKTKKSIKTAEPVPVVLQEYTVPHAEHYDGFKRIKIATYKDARAYKGIKALGRTPIKAVTFSFVKSGNYRPLHILANAKYIGTIWRDSWEQYYKDIKAEKIQAAHIEILDQDEVFLYIQYK